MMAAFGVMFGAGFAMHLAAREAGLWESVWIDLALAWAYSVPLWAALTAWLAGGEEPKLLGKPRNGASLVARLLGAVAVIALFGALREGASSLWLPLCFLAAALGWYADAAEQGGLDVRNVPWLLWALRRAAGIVLVFHYVCLTWIFFRAQTFDGALAVLEQLALLEFDPDQHWANITSLVQLALVAAVLTPLLCPAHAGLVARALCHGAVCDPGRSPGGGCAGAARACGAAHRPVHLLPVLTSRAPSER